MSANSSGSGVAALSGEGVQLDGSEPSQEEQNAIQALLTTLFVRQQERALAQKRSKEIYAEMQKIKERCQQWMQHYGFVDLDNEAFSRRLKRSERKIFRKTTPAVLLDWIECEDGIERRRHYEQRIKAYEKEPIDTRIEYRITNMGLRKRGEKVSANSLPLTEEPHSNQNPLQVVETSVISASSSSSSSGSSIRGDPKRQQKRLRAV